jgi:hypothetical protein
MVRDFALAMLRRLQSRDKPMRQDVQMNGGDSDENMEDGQLPPEDLVPSPYLPDSIELPAQKAQVLQHVELLFALSVKVPEFLEECVTCRFYCSAIYASMQNFHGLWANGRDRPRSDPATHHPAHQIARIEPWKAANSDARLPTWVRITRIARADDFHGEWETQHAASSTSQRTHQRARP